LQWGARYSPVSKLKTKELLEKNYGVNIPLEKIYRMMDHVAEQEAKIKEQVTFSTLALFYDRVDIVLFDVTTLYFESTETDEIREFGFSKDCKFKEVQIVLALATTQDGLPLTYEIFAGNTFEGHTFIRVVESLKNRFNINKVVIIADRAMFSVENLRFLESQGFSYIIAAKLRTLPKKLKEEILYSVTFRPKVVENEFLWINEFSYDNKRLVVSYSSKRARKDALFRARLIERLVNKFKSGKINLKDLIPNYGTKRFIKIENTTAVIDEAKILKETQWDGLHGVITNDFIISAPTVLSYYCSLWHVEEAFRIQKHDLKIRPIYHWTPKRIRGHIAICFVAYTVLKHALYSLSKSDIKISPERLCSELIAAQATIIRNKVTGKRYAMPSPVTPLQQAIYGTFGLRRSQTPRRLN